LRRKRARDQQKCRQAGCFNMIAIQLATSGFASAPARACSVDVRSNGVTLEPVAPMHLFLRT